KERGGVRSRSIERFERGTLVLEVPLEAADAPGVDLVVASVDSGTLHVGRATVSVTTPRPLAAQVAPEAGSEPLAVTARATTLGLPERGELNVSATDARLADLLRATNAAHGPTPPAAGAFVSDGVRVAEPRVERAPAPPEDRALVARASALDLAPDLAVATIADDQGRATVELPVSGAVLVR